MGISHIFEARQRKDGMNESDTIALLERIVETIAKGTEIRRGERNGSDQAVIELEGIEAVLVRNKGSNTWLLNGWEVNPVATKAANDALGATRRSADSSDRTVGAGFDENNTPEPRFSQDGQIQTVGNK